MHIRTNHATIVYNSVDNHDSDTKHEYNCIIMKNSSKYIN